MLTVQHFLCCISLNNGTLIIALLGLSGVFGGFSICIYELLKGNGIKTVINHNIFLIIDLIIGFVANICLLLAVKKRKPYFVLVYLFPDGILIIVGFIISIKETIVSAIAGDYSDSLYIIIASTIVAIVCAYIWIVLYSFFIELKQNFVYNKENNVSSEV